MTSKTASEMKLLQASLTGSREAFGTIVERYQSLICGITYSATGDLGKSEELAQEAFIRAWKQLRQLKDFGSFRAWLCTITRNLVSKSIKEKQRDIVGDARPLEYIVEFKSAERGPVETAISKEQEAVVWGALKEIPEAYREPMVLFYREQQSVRQVAAEIGLSEDVAKQRLSRGRKLLRAEVASLVEDVIGRTGPGKVFTVAVVAALPAIVPQVASAAIAGTVAKGSAAAKSAWLLSSVGAMLGPLLGFWGAVIGIKAKIADAKSSRERTFIKEALLKGVLYYLAGVTTIFLLGWQLNELRLKMWPIIPLFVVFMLTFPVWGILNRRRLRQIQREEGTYVQDEHKVLEMSKGSIYGGYAGSIFAVFGWLYVTAYFARDWTVLWTVVTAAVVIFWAATKLCLRSRQQFYRVGMGVFVLAGLINLLVLNLRWETWKAVLQYHRVVTLRQMNLIMVAAVAAMVVWALILDLRLQKITKKGHRD